jgi:small-conductance mechanosensitive channel
MSGLTEQPFFWPALMVIIGLPIALLVLNEIQGVLRRRDSAFVKPVALVRNWLLPAFAVYLLLNQLTHSGAKIGDHATWARIAATVVGFVIMLTILSGANAALFGTADLGSWRSRLPSIFVSLGRLILIIIGIGLLLSWVWGANIGGLITAVGVTSIVIGLAVQNAVGPVISGLLLLFEQPFRLGDWLDTKFGKGRVVEVNWRAVHLDTENGVQVVPNAALAGDSFTNLSRTVAPYYKAKAWFAFSAEDPPGQVKRVLLSVADGLPAKLNDVKALAIPKGTHEVHPGLVNYLMLVPVASPGEADGAASMLRLRVWYAAQRAGLHLDNVASGDSRSSAYLAEQMGVLAAGLGLDQDAAATMLASSRVLLFAEGEIIQAVDSVPESMCFIADGQASMFATTPQGAVIPLGNLGPGDFIGGAALTRQKMTVGVSSTTDTTLIAVDTDAMNAIVKRDHRLAKQIGDAVELRRQARREAIAEAARHGVV